MERRGGELVVLGFQRCEVVWDRNGEYLSEKLIREVEDETVVF